MAYEVFSNTQALRVIGDMLETVEGKREIALQHLGKMMYLYRNANKNK